MTQPATQGVEDEGEGEAEEEEEEEEEADDEEPPLRVISDLQELFALTDPDPMYLCHKVHTCVVDARASVPHMHSECTCIGRYCSRHLGLDTGSSRKQWRPTRTQTQNATLTRTCLVTSDIPSKHITPTH